MQDVGQNAERNTGTRACIHRDLRESFNKRRSQLPLITVCTRDSLGPATQGRHCYTIIAQPGFHAWLESTDSEGCSQHLPGMWLFSASYCVLLVTDGMSRVVDTVAATPMLPVGSPVTTPPNGEPLTHFFHRSPEHCSVSLAAINKMRQNTQVPAI